MQPDPWFPFAKPRGTSRVLLFCFAHAGGGASAFRRWGDLLPPEVEPVAVQLPGRETRLREPARRRLDALIAELAPAVLARLDRPYALFGHSLGAKIAFHLARRLRRHGAPPPKHLLVSGANAPHVPRRGPDVHALSDAPLIEELTRLSGTPPAILENRELMAMLLPALRADFEMSETHVYRPEPPLLTPITAFMGADDPETDDAGIDAWSEITESAFRSERLAGDHFYYLNDPSPLVSIVARELALP